MAAAAKRSGAGIKSFHNPDPINDGLIRFYDRGNGEFAIDANLGSHRCGMETDRQSLVELRDALNEILGE